MMAPRRDSRTVSLFRLVFNARPATITKRVRGIAPYQLEDVIAALQKAVAKDSASRGYKLDGSPIEGSPPNGTIQVRLEEIVPQKKPVGSYALRFSYLNPMAADRGKRELGTGVRTFLEINDGEVGEVGAHLLVAAPDTNGPRIGLSRCVLEQMPGLSRTKIISLISSVAEEFMSPAARPTFQYREGKGKAKRILQGLTRLQVTSTVEKSETLEDELKGGALKAVRFIGPATETDNFSIDGLGKLEQEIFASVKSTHSTGAKAISLINNARARAKAFGWRARLDIEKEEDGITRGRIRELDLDKAGLADQLYARQEVIHSSNGFPECYETLHADTISGLVDIVQRKEFWT